MKPDKDPRVTTTKRKGNVTINPKKEDLMTESLRRRLQYSVDELKESAKKKDKEKRVKRWWDDDGDGVGYEKGEVSGKFKKEETEESCEYDDSEAKKKSKDRMKQKMLQATADHDEAKKYGRK
jgi:hypothetical protein